MGERDSVFREDMPLWTDEVIDQLVDAVEDEVGMGAGAWDTIDPRKIAAAFVYVLSTPADDGDFSRLMARTIPADESD